MVIPGLFLGELAEGVAAAAAARRCAKRLGFLLTDVNDGGALRLTEAEET